MPKVSDPGPGRLFNSLLAMGLFPASLKGSISISKIVVPVGKWATHFATSCPLTACLHMTQPSVHLTEHWWASCHSNKYSRSKIIQRVNFLTDNEVFFKLDPGIDSNFSDSVAIPQ
ncbi:hypothetical protein AVEN_161432-1 [Araneus ventricosus]|uniref:Uncharacterized protein n=1 Tax=Araneus ventricosus TaxID=182803 RepID=A0A4Y2LK73_ARAVE|nr:hypothetical protein AVEN_161432-1 [Araneus ventricosus]